MSAIENLKKEQRQKMARFRDKLSVEQLENTLVRKTAVVATAGTYGTLNRLFVPNDVGGFPWKLAVLLMSQLGEGLSRGKLQAALGGIADSTMAVYIERSIANNTLISGQEVIDTDSTRDVIDTNGSPV